MATIATITGNVVAFSDPGDVEADSSTSPQGVVNIKLPNAAGQSAFITLEPVAASILAALSVGSCTVTITQP